MQQTNPNDYMKLCGKNYIGLYHVYKSVIQQISAESCLAAGFCCPLFSTHLYYDELFHGVDHSESDVCCCHTSHAYANESYNALP